MPRPSTGDRARRLLSLLPYLGEQGSIPLSQIAAVTGTDEATAASDLTLLSLCGVDDWTLIGVLVDGDSAEVFARLPALDRPVRLTPAEARALVTALGSLGLDEHSPLAERLAHVAGHDADLAELASTMRASLAPGGQADVIAALAYAAGRRRAVRMRYMSAESGEETVRVVHPYALYVWRGAWYLLAWCERSEAERTFRVDRVSGVAQTSARFERPAGLPASPSPLPDLDALPVAKVRFARWAPDLNDRDWPGARFEMEDDGTVLGLIPYAGTAWIAAKVAARLGEAVVIEPEEVRAATVVRARLLLGEN